MREISLASYSTLSQDSLSTSTEWDLSLSWESVEPSAMWLSYAFQALALLGFPLPHGMKTDLPSASHPPMRAEPQKRQLSRT
jgi:hypothetical protein